MAKEQLKENLANLRNMQIHLWTAMLVTISGSFALLQSFNTLLNKFLVVIGIALFLFLLNAYLNKKAGGLINDSISNNYACDYCSNFNLCSL